MHASICSHSFCVRMLTLLGNLYRRKIWCCSKLGVLRLSSEYLLVATNEDADASLDLNSPFAVLEQPAKLRCLLGCHEL